MTSMPWNFFREPEDLIDRYSRLVGHEYLSEADALALSDRTPATDTCEDQDRFIITLELPDVPRQAIEVSAVDC